MPDMLFIRKFFFRNLFTFFNFDDKNVTKDWLRKNYKKSKKKWPKKSKKNDKKKPKINKNDYEKLTKND